MVHWYTHTLQVVLVDTEHDVTLIPPHGMVSLPANLLLSLLHPFTATSIKDTAFLTHRHTTIGGATWLSITDLLWHNSIGSGRP